MKVISVLEAYCNENNKYHTLKQLKHLFDTQLKGVHVQRCKKKMI
jgi:hypothetical protein